MQITFIDLTSAASTPSSVLGIHQGCAQTLWRAGAQEKMRSCHPKPNVLTCFHEIHFVIQSHSTNGFVRKGKLERIQVDGIQTGVF